VTTDSGLLDFLGSVEVALDPVSRFRKVIGDPDEWQERYLSSVSQFTLLLCGRQVGKSTTTACLAWSTMCLGKTVLICAPSERQSKELHRKILDFQKGDPDAPKTIRSTLTELELSNGGRVICVPASSDTVRGFTVHLLIIEEAAFVDDDTIIALLPMRAKDGRVVMISTPAGRDGFFYNTWEAAAVERIHARSVDIPRLKEKVAFDKKFMPAVRFRQEHLCQFLGSGTPFFDPDSLQSAISPYARALVL
jgi:hypothetical protein